MKLKIEVNYENNHERKQMLKRVNSLISSGLRSYNSREYSFSIDGEVNAQNFVRFEMVNDQKCMIIQSKLNIE